MYKRWEQKKDRFSARHLLRWLKKAKTWQLVLVLILLGFISATFLRLNNIGMIEKREAVIMADKKLNSADTKKKLTELQHYVSSHMNSSMGGGIELNETYQRDYNAAVKAAADAHNPNSDVYQKASIECRAKFRGNRESFQNDYVTCVAKAVANLPNNSQNPDLPQKINYRYNFASPLISPDFAGFSVITTILLALFILLRLIALYSLKFIIKRRAKVF